MHKKTKLMTAGLFAVLLGVCISAKANAQVVYTDSCGGIMPDYYTSVESPVVIGDPYYNAGFYPGYGYGWGNHLFGLSTPIGGLSLF